MNMTGDEEFDDFPINLDEILKIEELHTGSQQGPSRSSNPNVQRSIPSDKSPAAEIEFHLRRLEIAQSTNSEELLNELKDAKQIIEVKDRTILLLKEELSSYRERGSHEVAEKRSYPGSISPTTQKKTRKKKVSSKPSMFTGIENSFSSQLSTQVPMQSPTPFNVQTSTQSQTLPIQTPPIQTPSIQTPSIQTPSIQTPQPKVIKQDSSSISTIKNKKSKSKTKKNNNALLTVLFTPLFQKWNRENHNNTKDINICLTPDMIRYFSDEFSRQIIPERTQCSSREHFKHLVLLADDIFSHLVKSENEESSIQFLLNVFKLSLPICIKEKLITPIEHIVTSVCILASIFPFAKTLLTKDLIFDAQSIVTHLSTCLSFFSFQRPKPNVLISEVPHIQARPMKTIVNLSKTHSTTATDILNVINQKKPTKKGFYIVKSILQLFYLINSQDEIPRFDFLMENSGFLNLLDINQPFVLIMQSLSVLETNFLSEAHMQSYKDTEFKVVKCLANLIASSQGSLTSKEWYTLRLKALNIFYAMSDLTIAKQMVVGIHKILFQTTNNLLKDIAITFNEKRPYVSIEDRKQIDSLMKITVETMYNTLFNCPEDIFVCLKEISPQSVLGYPDFFQKKGIDENHMAGRALSDLTTYLLVYHKQNRIKF